MITLNGLLLSILFNSLPRVRQGIIRKNLVILAIRYRRLLSNR